MEERVEKEYKIVMVGNELLTLGFKLAGVSESYNAADPKETESRMRELLSRSDVGIVIVSSSVRRQIRDRRLQDIMSESILPLVVEVPEPGESMAEEDTLRSLILRAIGIDITKMGK